MISYLGEAEAGQLLLIDAARQHQDQTLIGLGLQEGLDFFYDHLLARRSGLLSEAYLADAGVAAEGQPVDAMEVHLPLLLVVEVLDHQAHLPVDVLVAADILVHLGELAESLGHVPAHFVQQVREPSDLLPPDFNFGIALVVERHVVDPAGPVPAHHHEVFAWIEHGRDGYSLLSGVCSADVPVAVDVLADQHQAHPRVGISVFAVVLVVLLDDRQLAAPEAVHRECAQRDRVFLLLDDTPHRVEGAVDLVDHQSPQVLTKLLQTDELDLLAATANELQASLQVLRPNDFIFAFSDGYNFLTAPSDTQHNILLVHQACLESKLCTATIAFHLHSLGHEAGQIFHHVYDIIIKKALEGGVNFGKCFLQQERPYLNLVELVGTGTQEHWYVVAAHLPDGDVIVYDNVLPHALVVESQVVDPVFGVLLVLEYALQASSAGSEGVEASCHVAQLLKLARCHQAALIAVGQHQPAAPEDVLQAHPSDVPAVVGECFGVKEGGAPGWEHVVKEFLVLVCEQLQQVIVLFVIAAYA